MELWDKFMYEILESAKSFAEGEDATLVKAQPRSVRSAGLNEFLVAHGAEEVEVSESGHPRRDSSVSVLSLLYLLESGVPTLNEALRLGVADSWASVAPHVVNADDYVIELRRQLRVLGDTLPRVDVDGNDTDAPLSYTQIVVTRTTSELNGAADATSLLTEMVDNHKLGLLVFGDVGRSGGVTVGGGASSSSSSSSSSALAVCASDASKMLLLEPGVELAHAPVNKTAATSKWTIFYCPATIDGSVGERQQEN